MLIIANERANALSRIPKAAALALIILAALAAAISYRVTRAGVGFEADSIVYVSAARTLGEQGRLLIPDLQGNLVPLSHWPPLYPAMLAALSPVAGDALKAARDLNIVLFPVNLLLLAWLAWRTTRSASTMLVIAAVFLLSPNLLDIHITAMSEAPSLTCWLAGLLLLVEYRRSGSWRWLLGAALAAAACVVVRYVGIVLIITGAGFIMIYTTGSGVRRGLSGLLYFTAAMVPLAGWLLSRPGSGVDTERHLGYYGLGSEQIAAAAVAMIRWLAPLDKYGALKLGLAALLAGGAIILMVSLLRTKPLPPSEKTPPPGPDCAPAQLFAANFIVYELLLLGCGLFLDPRQDIGERMQTLPFVFLLLLAGVVWAAWMRGRLPMANGFGKKLAAGWLGLLLGTRLVSAALWAKTAEQDRLGYNDPAWRNSPAIALIKSRYATVPVYANYLAALYLQTGRADLQRLPEAADDLRHQKDPEFDRQMTEMLGAMAKNNGVLVVFKSKNSRYLSVEQLAAYPGLQVVQDTADATLFRAKER